MRYRKLDAAGDYVLGGQAAFHVNTPEAVAQAIRTRLALWRGEWFLDAKEGTPWNQEVLGKRVRGRSPDAAVRSRILGTPGVIEIVSYTSSFDGDSRSLSITATVRTQYGTATITETL